MANTKKKITPPTGEPTPAALVVAAIQQGETLLQAIKDNLTGLCLSHPAREELLQDWLPDIETCLTRLLELTAYISDLRWKHPDAEAAFVTYAATHPPTGLPAQPGERID